MSEQPTSPEKPVKVPPWWKNTYFAISLFLLIVGIIGLAFGPATIHDPGQKNEDKVVVVLYLAAAVIMFVNGYVSHKQTLQTYYEALED